ncbi:hypothetical protein PR202_gb24837 [Eleusine coracana subsp. coracana]|uniref:Uncharacterized protein n=1 Tax=Eleusine coracana subsp. coracana TaxID=191504 RepID=A0AAV5FK37_ELECO|nr:hypothetical protein PR202_gb24837 [Eleusine coracana subsp. coracana]
MDHMSDGESEVEAYEEDTYALLVSGDLKVMTDKGLYRCPFCSDAENECSLLDLLQHALDVGTAHDRDTKEKADHRSLAKHLKGKPAESPGSLLQSVPTDLQAPQQNRDEQFVWPWMGVLVNMPDEYIGRSANRLKEHFISFNPTKVHHVYSKGYPTGNAIVEFGKEWSGFRNARAFESHFEMKGYSKKQWKEMKCAGQEAVGWIARADDYNSLGAIGEHLRKNGDLKTFSDIESEETNKAEKLVAHLAHNVKEKETYLTALQCEYSKSAASLETMMEEREKKIQSYNREIQKMRQLAQQNTHRVVEENQKLRVDLQGMIDELDARTKQIEELASQTEQDKRDLELEKEKNAKRTDRLRLAALEQQKASENVQKVMEKQQIEEEAALEKFKRLTIQLDTKQTLELEIEHLAGKLHVMECTSVVEDSRSGETVKELKKELEEKIEELNDADSMNQALIIQESKASDEMREARDVMIKALQGLPDDIEVRTKIEIKTIGELDPKVFLNVCKQKFSKKEAKAESVILCTKWQNEINNPGWNPFKVVMVNGKESVNWNCLAFNPLCVSTFVQDVLREDDPKLQELREFGEEAYAAVTKALIDLNTGGGSRRNPFPVLWNPEADRKALMKEAVQHAVELWKASKAKGKKGR